MKTDWNIDELEQFFKSASLPPPPIKLSPVCTITNVPGYIEYHISVVRANNGKETFRPYLKRLQRLKEFINNRQIAAVNESKTITK